MCPLHQFYRDNTGTKQDIIRHDDIEDINDLILFTSYQKEGVEEESYKGTLWFFIIKMYLWSWAANQRRQNKTWFISKTLK